eukprot:gene3432-2383_t
MLFRLLRVLGAGVLFWVCVTSAVLFYFNVKRGAMTFVVRMWRVVCLMRLSVVDLICGVFCGLCVVLFTMNYGCELLFNFLTVLKLTRGLVFTHNVCFFGCGGGLLADMIVMRERTAGANLCLGLFVCMVLIYFMCAFMFVHSDFVDLVAAIFAGLMYFAHCSIVGLFVMVDIRISVNMMHLWLLMNGCCLEVCLIACLCAAGGFGSCACIGFLVVPILGFDFASDLSECLLLWLTTLFGFGLRLPVWLSCFMFIEGYVLLRYVICGCSYRFTVLRDICAVLCARGLVVVFRQFCVSLLLWLGLGFTLGVGMWVDKVCSRSVHIMVVTYFLIIVWFTSLLVYVYEPQCCYVNFGLVYEVLGGVGLLLLGFALQLLLRLCYDLVGVHGCSGNAFVVGCLVLLWADDARVQW